MRLHAHDKQSCGNSLLEGEGLRLNTRLHGHDAHFLGAQAQQGRYLQCQPVLPRVGEARHDDRQSQGLRLHSCSDQQASLHCNICCRASRVWCLRRLQSQQQHAPEACSTLSARLAVRHRRSEVQQAPVWAEPPPARL